MATEQTTIAVYAITGNTRRFPVPFEYLSRQFVVVTLLGVGRTVLTLGSDYRFISLNEIETTVAYGGTDGNNLIEIRRVTSASDRLVEFADGSVLRSRDMNVSAIQTIHIAEEARNLAADTLASDDDGNLDARGRRLVNLGDAVNPKDAITLDQVMEWDQSALNQANASAASAAAALVSQNAAAESESAAKTSEINAKTSEINAAESESAAKTSEINAAESESAAKTSEINAAESESAAKTSEGLAQEWAENPVDVPVVDDRFSSKHWAQKAHDHVSGESYLHRQDNLSDLTDVASARSNLELAAMDVAPTAWTLVLRDTNGTFKAGTPTDHAHPLRLGDIWYTRALGEEVWLDDSNPAVEVPPTDNPSFRYIKLTAGENGPDGYNGGVLINETVSGSAPRIEATAEIDLPDSPFHGQTVRLLNTERRFVRAGEAGVVQDDALQGHEHMFSGWTNSTSGGASWGGGNESRKYNTSAIIAKSGYGAPRVAVETRPRNIGRTVYMRIL